MGGVVVVVVVMGQSEAFNDNLGYNLIKLLTISYSIDERLYIISTCSKAHKADSRNFFSFLVHAEVITPKIAFGAEGS